MERRAQGLHISVPLRGSVSDLPGALHRPSPLQPPNIICGRCLMSHPPDVRTASACCQPYQVISVMLYKKKQQQRLGPALAPPSSSEHAVLSCRKSLQPARILQGVPAVPCTCRSSMTRYLILLHCKTAMARKTCGYICSVHCWLPCRAGSSRGRSDSGRVCGVQEDIAAKFGEAPGMDGKPPAAIAVA